MPNQNSNPYPNLRQLGFENPCLTPNLANKLKLKTPISKAIISRNQISQYIILKPKFAKHIQIFVSRQEIESVGLLFNLKVRQHATDIQIDFYWITLYISIIFFFFFYCILFYFSRPFLDSRCLTHIPQFTFSMNEIGSILFFLKKTQFRKHGYYVIFTKIAMPHYLSTVPISFRHDSVSRYLNS